jgi:mevalonate kinase
MGAGEACGKVILLGEHAVVYGVPAIAVGITRGARARATALPEGPSRLRVSGWEVTVTDADPENDVARAFAALLDVARSEDPSLPSVAVEIEAELPPGGGLGCSAAMGVAIGRAVGRKPSEEAVQARAMAWERVFHGNPSGVDAAVAARGGCLFFRKGEDGAQPRRGQHVIESVRLRGPLHLCVGSTGSASSTKAMVDAVARLKARRPDVVAKSFEAIRSLVANARLAIEAGDRFALGRLLDLNQMLLSGLFVSTPDIERLCELARSCGALGAKLTGAGGGGSVVALVPSTSVGDAVLAAWKADGFDGFATVVAPDVRSAAMESESAP